MVDPKKYNKKHIIGLSTSLKTIVFLHLLWQKNVFKLILNHTENYLKFC